MKTMQIHTHDQVQKHISKQVSRISRRLKQRLTTFQIDEDYLIESRIVSATSLKQALQKSPKLSLSTMILLENATGGSLYLKFVPLQGGKSTYCLRLTDPSRLRLAVIFARFFKPLMQEKNPDNLAQRSGLSYTTIKNLKNETHMPSLKTVFKMARALGYEAYLVTKEKTIFKI